MQDITTNTTTNIIVGIDEAGRGPWAGPVVASACFIPKGHKLHKEVKDSKKLSHQKRELLSDEIKKHCLYGIGKSSSLEIDKIGIKKATNKAMKKAVSSLLKKHPTAKIDLLQIDGNDKFKFNFESEDIIKGDEKISHISAASIIAKVERDKIMQRESKKYPQYGFNNHKGYGTKEHQEALKKHGTCKIHRFSYKPVAAIENK
jgi:ribonuclease HII